MLNQALPAQLPREWIAARIPHHGSMCLLDQVHEWSAEHIVCHTQTHTLADNPLRAEGRLGIACGVEYAAQAIAVHCAILLASQTDSAQAAQQATSGYIAALRNVENHVAQLDNLTGSLHIRAERQAALSGGAMYAFTLHHDSHLLQAGRITLMLGSA